MKTHQISYDDIIEFFRIYTDYLEYVLYVSLTKKGINKNIHIFFMKSFVILTSKKDISRKKDILKKTKKSSTNIF